MKFTVEGQEYMIGTKMFPVSDKNNIHTFNSANTCVYNNEDLNRILDANEFEIGQCYINAEKLRLIGEGVGLPIDYYTGWVFLPKNEAPMHHSWSVIDGKHLIDMGFSPRLLNFQEKLVGDPNWRDRFAEEVAYTRKMFSNSKNCVMGKVPNNVTYVGSLDSMEPSRKRIRDTMVRFPNHISYRRKGMNTSGATPIQKAVWMLEGK